VTARQLEGLIAIALDKSAPEDERVEAGALANEEIQRIEKASGQLHPQRWDVFDAMTGDFDRLDRPRS
jgi:hypothetical protein